MHGDILLIGTGPFAWIALFHHLHQPLDDRLIRFLHASLQQGQDVGHHFGGGDVVIPPVVRARLVFVPSTQSLIDGAEKHIVSVECTFGVGIGGAELAHVVEVRSRLPVGTEEAFVVNLCPGAIWREHLHQACGSLVEFLQRCRFVELLPNPLQHQFVIVLRLHRFHLLAACLRGVEEVDVGVFGQNHTAGHSECGGLFQVGEHLGGYAEALHFAPIGGIGDAHCSLRTGGVGLFAPFGGGTAAAGDDLLDNEWLFAGVREVEVVADAAIQFVNLAEVVLVFRKGNLLSLAHQAGAESHQEGEEHLFHGLYAVFKKLSFDKCSD